MHLGAMIEPRVWQARLCVAQHFSPLADSYGYPRTANSFASLQARCQIKKEQVQEMCSCKVVRLGVPI